MKYHYKLHFEKPTDINYSDDEDDDKNIKIGHIISGKMNDLELNGAIFLTNAKFEHPGTAKKYLCLTYTPRFRYVINKDGVPDDLEPDFIRLKSDDNHFITKRTVPAFGSIGGIGEWVILTKNIPDDTNLNKINLFTDYHYEEGGETERWYMGAWNRELLANISSGFTGHIITAEDLQKSIYKEQKIEKIISTDDYVLGFWPGKEKRALLAIKPSGMVAYAPLKKFEYQKDKLYGIFYLSVSCVFQKGTDTIYIKFYGALWEDFFLCKSDYPCDNIYDDLKNTSESKSFLHCSHNVSKIINKFEIGADALNACGVRFCSYVVETEELAVSSNLKDDNNRERTREIIGRLVAGIKEYLLGYSNKYERLPFDYCFCPWCCSKKSIVILPKLDDNLKF